MRGGRAGGRQTVLAMAASQRVGFAAALLLLLWIAVGWALDWWL